MVGPAGFPGAGLDPFLDLGAGAGVLTSHPFTSCVPITSPVEHVNQDGNIGEGAAVSIFVSCTSKG